MLPLQVPLKKAELNRLIEKIETAKNIVIVAHKNPDGDALGSTLGLLHILKNKGKSCRIILPNAYPSMLQWMPGITNVWIFEKNKIKSTDAINKADFIFCLDFNSLSRIEEMGELPAFKEKTSLLLDHHPQPDSFASFCWSDVNASSTCELVYNLADTLGYIDAINKDAAICLYTGLVTDTGSFRFAATTAHTLRIASFLMEKGIEHYKIQEEVFSNNKLSKLKLWGYALSQKLNFIEKYSTAYILLTKEELQRYEFEDGDLEGLVNYALSVKGAKLGILMTEKTDRIRMSFRSKTDFSSNLFARKYFNGGGHEMAAGGTSFDSADATIIKLLEALESFHNEQE
jgi:phosphoesterase RecJ-like protein